LFLEVGVALTALMKEFITVQCCKGGEWRKKCSERAARNVENGAVETIKSG